MPAILLALLPTLLSAIVPVATDGIRGIFNWITGGAGAQPANVDEAVKLMEAETRKLEAVAKLDTPVGDISPWVADLRASFRYLGASVVILLAPIFAVWVLYAPTPERLQLFEFFMLQVLGPIWGFLYGQRLSISLRKK